MIRLVPLSASILSEMRQEKLLKLPLAKTLPNLFNFGHQYLESREPAQSIAKEKINLALEKKYRFGDLEWQQLMDGIRAANEDSILQIDGSKLKKLELYLSKAPNPFDNNLGAANRELSNIHYSREETRKKYALNLSNKEKFQRLKECLYRLKKLLRKKFTDVGDLNKARSLLVKKIAEAIKEPNKTIIINSFLGGTKMQRISQDDPLVQKLFYFCCNQKTFTQFVDDLVDLI